MGRLQALATGIIAAIALCAGASCDKDGGATAPPPPTTGRSEAVKASDRLPATPTAPAATATMHHATAPAAPRELCKGQLGAGHPLPSKPVSHAEAPGAPPLGDQVTVGGGRWTWINFWAAWCGPCREEMPRLRGWEQKLAQAGTPIGLAFVSMDDDERQLRQFLDGQPMTGVRASYWLPDGPIREAWLSTLKMKDPPDLPAHALVDPSGQVRCVVQGAVEDADFAQVAAIVGRR
jgi:thiol-disulfide isomerase/thioredoxin